MQEVTTIGMFLHTIALPSLEISIFILIMIVFFQRESVCVIYVLLMMLRKKFQKQWRQQE